MDTRSNDRRGFFREAFTRLAREVATRTERRVAPRKYFRPPGAIDEFGFLASRGADYHGPGESPCEPGRLPPLHGSLTPVWSTWAH